MAGEELCSRRRGGEPVWRKTLHDALEQIDVSGALDQRGQPSGPVCGDDQSARTARLQAEALPRDRQHPRDAERVVTRLHDDTPSRGRIFTMTPLRH